MIDKYAQIQKMLDFLNLKCRSDQNEYVVEGILYIDVDADYKCAIVNFDNKTIKWEAEDVSGHNGDYYNRRTGNLPWDQVLTIHSKLETMVKSKIKEDLRKKEENKINKMIDKKINNLFEKIIDE